MVEQPARRGPRATFVVTWLISVVLGFGLVITSIAYLANGRWQALGLPLIMTAGLVLLSELRPIVMTRYAGEAVSISQAFVFATLYVWGPAPAVTLMAAAILLGELIARKALWKLLFNVGQYAVSVAAAGLFLAPFDIMGTPTEPSSLRAVDLPWIVLSWLVYHLVNLALVAGVAQDQSWWESFTEDFWFYTGSTLAVLALSPLVAVIALAQPGSDSWMLLPLLMLPLLAVQRTAQMSQEREHRALHDPLTGLPNRALLTDRIETALARSPRSGGRVVLIFLDLDLFKDVNDGLGHVVGDQLLVDVAGRLSSVLRRGDTLARFSGDEFAIVCEGIPDYEIDSVAARIRTILEPAFRFDSHEVTITASIGVATATPYSTPQSLLREADSAMYRAKSAGRDQVARFHRSMHVAAEARLDDQFGLRRALERDELRAHYQPVIDMTTGELKGLEALIRWEHPERGLLAPDQFIPLAEETGLILPLGAWMLDEALQQLALWRDDELVADDLWMAVNLSPRQLADPDLNHKVRRSLHDSGIPAHCLHLEITETAVIKSLSRSTRTLEDLRALGLRLIIDDFGTGYSSLARLKRLPVTALKVDRSFVDGLGRDSSTSDQSIVDAITQLAASLHLDVIAEGVETRTQLEILRRLGLRMGQGYYWSRPLPADRLRAWVTSVPRARDLAEYRASIRRA